MHTRKVTGLAYLLGLISMINGLLMIISPEQWYWLVPGVPDRGPFNQHFVRDIGFIYFLNGFVFLVGAFYPKNRFYLWILPASWLATHAIFHLWEIAVGICGPEFFIQDFPGVTLPALVAIWLVTKSRPQENNV